MNTTPIQITLYSGEDDSVQKTFTRSIIPWRVLKRAVRLQGLNAEQLTEEDVDAIASLVVEAFGDQFSLDELNNGAELGEMMAVLTNIVARANGTLQANPTKPQAPKK